MAFRLIEVFLPEGNEAHIRDALQEQAVLGVWHERMSEGQLMVKVLLDAEDAEAVLDVLNRFSTEEGYRIVLLPVEATLPRPESSKKEDLSKENDEKSSRKKRRISREELHADVSESVKLTGVFIVMVILSTLVAAIGLLKDSAAIVIGAMVIAPLLGPNVALALATTLADFELLRRSLRANLIGVSIAFALTFAIGFFFSITPGVELPLSEKTEIDARINVDPGDIVLALVSGVAGALSLTTGLSTTLIGVMVAVALLPPLATFGILLGAMEVQMALRALLLLLTNVICVNLAGVTTFLIQGIRPATWWEAKRAQKATRNALFVWVLLLIALAVIILLSRPQ